ncbi:SNF2-related protein, partial [Capnocytophaga sputigena]|uniref:SNF2-related protein n=1 Tax=Capnocytophaga sputigena TaxID=1019 RepID=UPI0028EE52E4
MMHNNLIDNSSDALSMQRYLKRCILAEGVDKIQIATGYWDIPGMTLVLNELKSFLEREETSFELLIGKDPYVYTSMIKNPKYKDATYPYDFIRTDIHDLEIKEEYEDVIKLLLKYGGSSKIQIRIYTKNSKEEDEFLHSKCYIFSGSSHSFGIVGSSNFTKKGLLGNAELNYLETDPARITARPTHGSNAKGHICWFEEKWKLSKEWTQEFLEQIIKKSPIYIDIQKNTAQEFTPYEQYIKLLQLQFGDVVDKNLGQEIEGYLPAKVHKLDYQIEAVKRCISIMHEHGGFMLADVVGLGKTIIGTLIIKRFLSVPENDGRERKVLIITPPAIQSGWKKTIAMFDKDSDEKIAPYIDFITTGRIANVTEEDDWEENDDDSADSGEFVGTLQDKNYGFIVIDESHKFRNSTTFMYRSLDELIIKIGSNTGVYPYIGLLSATPQNNRPNDLKNQIYLFERNRNDSTLKKAESGNIEKFFADVNREYDLLINNRSNITEEERKQRLEAVSKKLRDCVLSDILERRTRTDVEKYYKEDVESQGLVFPKIVGPNTLKYIMDDELAQLFSDTMTIIAPNQNERLLTNEWLKYSRYRAIEYFVDPANEQKHTGRGNRGVNDVARQMATIM